MTKFWEWLLGDFDTDTPNPLKIFLALVSAIVLLIAWIYAIVFISFWFAFLPVLVLVVWYYLTV